jgi:Protein of unknown function (DUF3489)
MSIKFSDTQNALLRAASLRDDRYLTPSAGGKPALARKAATKLVELGLVREVKAKRDAPVWRRDDEAGCDYSLKLTAAGLKAVAGYLAGETERCEKPASSNDTMQAEVVAFPEAEYAGSKVAGPDELTATVDGVGAPRVGSKIAAVIAMRGRAEGATIDELVAAMGWLPHTTRAALTGLRKRGYELILDRSDRARGSIYRIVSGQELIRSAPPTGRSIGAEAIQGATVAPVDPRNDPAPASRKRRRLRATPTEMAQCHEAP